MTRLAVADWCNTDLPLEEVVPVENTHIAAEEAAEELVVVVVVVVEIERIDDAMEEAVERLELETVFGKMTGTSCECGYTIDLFT